MTSNPAPVAPGSHRMRAWLALWGGQLVSLVGTGLTNFALGVWVFQRSGSVTEYGLVIFFISLPGLIVAPLAGAVVDRFSRKAVLLVSDAGAAVVTLAAAGLLWADRLEIWHIYIFAGIASVLRTAQWPAYIAITTLMVPKRHFARMGGMMQFAQAASEVVAPIAAGFLMGAIGVEGVLLIDFATFLVGVTVLFLVPIPAPKRSAEGEAAAKRPLLAQLGYGFSYITSRPGLLGLLVFFAIVNLAGASSSVLLTPLVLSFADEGVLGMVMSVASAGMVVGSILMMVTGGPKRRIHGILAFGFVFGIGLAAVSLRPWAPLIAGAMFVVMLGLPVVVGSSQAIWQTKVPADVQGRVFAVRRMVAQATVPLAVLAAAPLADWVYEPAMAPGGAMAPIFGPLLGGVGEGRGIALLYLTVAILPILASAAGYLYRPVRDVEDLLPDVVDDEPEPAPADPALA